LAEALGAKVEWDPETRSVIVETDKTTGVFSDTDKTTGIVEDDVEAGWLSLSALKEKFAPTSGRVVQVKRGDQTMMRIENRGHWVELPCTPTMPRVEAESDTGTTIYARLLNGRMYVIESQLRAAGLL
jgi:hypothetical protein